MNRDSENQISGNAPQFRVNYALIFNASSNAMAFSEDRTGIIIDVNTAWVRTMGIQRDRALGMTALELGIWTNGEERQACIDLLAQHGNIIDFNAQLNTVEGATPHLISGQRLTMDGKGYFLWEFRNIGEQIKAAARLKKANADLLATLRAIPDLLFELSGTGEYLNVWTRNSALLAEQEEFLLGRNVRDVLPPPAAATVMAALAEARKTGFSQGQRINLELAPGKRWFELSTSVKEAPDSAEISFMMLSRDITERVAAESGLREREEMLAAIFSHAGDGIDLVDVETLRILEMNDAACRMMGYSRDEYLQLSLVDTQPDLDETQIRRVMDEVLRNGGASFEARHCGKSGKPFDVQLNIRPVKLHGRDVLVAVWRDISEAKMTRVALENEAAWHRALLQNSVEGICIFDSDKRVIEVNKRFADMLGYSSDELIGRHPWDWDVNLDETTIRGRYPSGLISSFSVETQHRRKNGSVYDAEISLQHLNISGRDVAVSIARDITDRKRALADLEAREEIFRSIVSQAGDSIVLMDPADFSFVEFNDATCNSLGYTRDEFAGLSLLDLQVDRTAEQVQAALAHILSTGKGDFIVRHRRKDGSARETRVTNRPVHVRGRTFVAAVWHDLTYHHAAEAALREERFVRETIMESIPGVFYALRTTGKLVFWNKRFESVTERTAAELNGFDVLELFKGDQKRLVADGIEKVFSEGAAGVEADLHGKSGASTPYFFTGRLIEMSGQPLLVGAGIDISDLKAAERQLRKLNAELEERVVERTSNLQFAHRQLSETQFAMDRVGIGITWTDVDTGRFVFANKYYAEFLGYSVDELLQLQVSDIDPNFPVDAYLHIVEELKAKTRLQFETIHLTKDGRRIPVEMNLYYRQQKEGLKPLLIAFMSDISRRKEAELALKEAIAEAEVANAAKSEFLANMSHEIRTPLNAILGLNYLLRRDAPLPSQVDRLDKIEVAGHHLLSLINDILDLSKIEAGRLELEYVDFHLSAVLDNVTSIIRDAAAKKGIVLKMDADHVPTWLRGDVTRLRQSLLNFAGNAVKFTEQGTISLRARLVKEEAGALMVRFEVEDTGIGLTATEQEKLFRKFQQADGAISRRFGGTGLGLALTKRLVELMGGEVGVSSTPGKGSIFWLCVPLERGHGPMPNPSPIDETLRAEKQLREQHFEASVLLVEDNSINIEVVQQMLHAVDLDVTVAEDGLVALEKASTRVYDLILMDMQMPRMNGLEATRAIRRLPGWAHVPIIALTANAFAEDRQACLAAGMDDMVTKPVDPGLLYARLMTWLPPGAGRHALPTDTSGEIHSEIDHDPLGRLRQLPGVDVAVGMAALRNNETKYLKLVKLFASSHEQDVGRLESFFATGDLKSAEQITHMLKGSAASIGLTAIADSATDLNRNMRNDEGRNQPDWYQAQLAVLKDAFHALVSALTD